jgi:diguanylate cyclase (GGDEF)-like protein/PAS domain S-box-containing protein
MATRSKRAPASRSKRPSPERGEQLLRLQYTVTRTLAEAPEAVQAVEGVLRAVCETEGWDVGHFWRLDPAAGVMRRFAYWTTPGFDAAQRFTEASREAEFAKGAGLIGAAWQAGTPTWIPDVTSNARARRKALAEETGLRAALLCPVSLERSVVGVMSFDCRRIRPPDDALLQALGAVTTLLGQFLQRASAEQRLRERERLLAAIVDHEPECVKVIDSGGLLLEMNPAGLRMIEARSIDEVRGQCIFPLVAAEHQAAFRELTRRVAAGEDGSLQFELVGIRGTRRWLETRAVPLPEDAAGRRLILGITRDVTERKAAEAALRESEARFRRTFELAGVGVAHIDLNRRFLRVNRRFCEILGYPEAELIGHTGREISHPDDLDAMNSQRPRLYAGEIDAVRGEKRYLRKDGSLVWVAYTLAIERDAAGNPQHEIAVYDDISVRKAAEDALRDSEMRFRSLTELSSDWFWEQDAEYRFTRLEGRNVTGGDESLRLSLIGRRRWDSGLQIEGGWDAHRALLDARQPFHDALMWRALEDGSRRYVSVSGEPMFSAGGRFAGYRGVGRDTTAEKRAEENLRRFRLSIDSSADMILLIDVASMRFVDMNSTACALLGYSREELLAMGPQDVLPVSREELARSYAALIESPTTVGSMNSHYRCKDGSQLPFESTRRVLQSDGRPLIVAISRDIRERIAAEEALRESEARFRALTEMSSDFFWETDAQHRLSAMVYGRSFAGKMDDAVGKAAWDVPSTHPDRAGWALLREKVDRRQPFRDFEFGRPRHDGGVRYFSVSGDPRLDARGAFAGYRGVGRDITDLVLTRERIAALAYHDPLTGLANRTSLAPALEQAVERTRRRGSKLAGVFLDLDGFKQINDLHGHDAGDRLLAALADRLRAALRSSDPVARLGGDEFFVVLEDLQNNAPAERVASKLLATVNQPFDLGEGKLASISGSIGISVFPDDAGDAVTLMKHADAAMYHAKQAGKNAYRFFVAGPAANDARPAAAEEKKI